MAHCIFRGLLTGSGGGGGGGGGGGCGFVLPTVWDDNFDCGAALDTAGTRFSGANAWTTFDGSASPVTRVLTGGELKIGTDSIGSAFSPSGAYQTCPSGDWTFETSVHMPLNAAFTETLGLYLAESGTGKSVTFGPAYSANPGFTPMMLARDGTTEFSKANIGSWTTDYIADVRISRVSGVFTFEYRLTPGTGSWTTQTSEAQTVRFTTAPDRVGVAKVNSVSNIGTNYGYFLYFTRTA